MTRLRSHPWPVLGIAWLAIAVGGCGKSPGNSCSEFLTDYGAGKFADAQKLLSSHSSGQFDQAAQAVGGQDKLFAAMEQARQADPARAVTKVEVLSVTVIKDKATAHYKTTTKGGETSDERRMDLVKENGQWKVDFDDFNAPWSRIDGVPRPEGGRGGRGGGGGGDGQGRRNRSAATEPG